MSIYKRPNIFFDEDGSFFFNGKDIIDDNVVVENKELVNQLAEYVPVTGGVVEGNLVIRGAVVMDGSLLQFSDGTQRSALTDGRLSKFNDAGDSVTNIYYISAANKTLITQNVELNGSLIIPDSFISIPKITGLTNELQTHTDNIATNTTKLTNVSYNANQTLITGELQTEELSCTSFVNDGSMLISNPFYEITDQKFNYLSSIDGDIGTKFDNQTTKNNIVDASLNSLNTFRDNQLVKNSIYDSSLNVLKIFEGNQLVLNIEHDASFNILHSFKSDQLNKNGVYDSSFNALELFESEQLLYNDVIDSSFNILYSFRNSQLEKNSKYDVSLNALELFKSEQLFYNDVIDSSFNILHSFKSAQLDKNIVYDSSLNVLQDFKTSQILKNTEYDLSLNVLQGFKTTQIDKNTEYDASLNSLQSFKTSQISTNDGFNTNINQALNGLSFKQNIISDNNKIPSSYISTELNENLATRLVSINNKITGLENFVSNVENLDVLKDIDFNNISDLVLTKASVSSVTDVSNNLATFIGEVEVAHNAISTELAHKATITSVTSVSESLNSFISTQQNNNITIASALDFKAPISLVTDVSNNLASFVSAQSITNTDVSSLLALKAPISLVTDVSNNLASFVSNQTATNVSVSSSLALKAPISLVTDVSNNLASFVSNQTATNVSVSSSLALKAPISLVTDVSNNLATFVSNQTTTNGNVSSAINLKQNIINDSNKLNASVIQTDLGENGDMTLNIVLTEFQSTLDYNTGSISSLADNKASISYVNEQLLLKQNVINNVNKLSASVVQTTYGVDGNMTLNNALTDLRSGLDYNTGSITDLNNNKANTSYVNEQLLLKQNVINSTNKLNATVVQTTYGADGNMTLNNALTDLRSGIDYNSGSITELNNNKANTLYVNEQLLLKQNTISTSNRLSSNNISTFISESNGVLNTVLQGLTDINTTQSENISDNANDIITERARITAHNGRISATEGNITLLQQADLAHDQRMNGIDTAIGTKQPTIGVNAKVSSAFISTNIGGVASTLDTVLSEHDTLIDALDNEKQDIISSSSKLSASLVDFSQSNIRFADYTSSINSKFVDIDGKIATLNGLQSGDVQSFADINQDLSDIDTAIIGLQNSKQNVISSLNKIEGSNVKYNNSISIIEKIDSLGSGGGGTTYPSISYNATDLVTTISDTTKVSNLKFSDDSIQTIAFSSTKNTDVSNAKAKLTDVTYSSGTTTINNNLLCNSITGATIDDIYNDIGTKQDILNSTTNKLPYLNINFTGSNFQYLDFGSSINTKMLSIDESITALETSVNTTQVGINQGFSDNISGLTTGKQNVLSNTNKLNSAFLACSGSGVMSNTKMEYLSSISGDIQSQLALKADASAISNINNTSDLSKPISTATQSALDTKWGIPSNASSLGFVDILSSLTGLLNNKWGTPSNATNLGFVDITSSLTGLLGAKANSTSPSLTGITSTEKISEKVTNTYTYGTNILNIDYTNNSIIYFNTLASSTNFAVYLTNVNPNSLTYTTFTITLIIDCATYNAYGNTCRINGSSYTLIASGGLANVSTTSANIIIQQISVLYLASGTLPSKVITSISPMF